MPDSPKRGKTSVFTPVPLMQSSVLCIALSKFTVRGEGACSCPAVVSGPALAKEDQDTSLTIISKLYTWGKELILQ